jgi:hypothetical protein
MVAVSARLSQMLKCLTLSAQLEVVSEDLTLSGSEPDTEVPEAPSAFFLWINLNTRRNDTILEHKSCQTNIHIISKGGDNKWHCGIGK